MPRQPAASRQDRCVLAASWANNPAEVVWKPATTRSASSARARRAPRRNSPASTASTVHPGRRRGADGHEGKSSKVAGRLATVDTRKPDRANAPYRTTTMRAIPSPALRRRSPDFRGPEGGYQRRLRCVAATKPGTSGTTLSAMTSTAGQRAAPIALLTPSPGTSSSCHRSQPLRRRSGRTTAGSRQPQGHSRCRDRFQGAIQELLRGSRRTHRPCGFSSRTPTRRDAGGNGQRDPALGSLRCHFRGSSVSSDATSCCPCR